MLIEMNYLQFGPYTLDRNARQLRRADALLPVSGKALDLLAYMASNPGRPLPKSELLSAVWPGSFVEEANLSQNVFLLRKVFGPDSASLIVTLPGVGYQFAAEVQTFPTRTQETLRTNVALEAVSTRVVVEEETEEHIAAWRSPWWLGLWSGTVVLLCVVGWLGSHWWLDSVGGAPVQVVLTEFDGTTGDSLLDHSLADALRMELAQSPFVTVLSSSLIRQTLVQMTHKPDERLTADLARDLCERTGSQVVLHGSIARPGSHFLLTEEATNCSDGSIVASAHFEAPAQESLPHSVDLLAATLRRKLGESRRTIHRFSAPLFPQTTGSIDALKDYSQALLLSQRGKLTEAIALLQQAVVADPNFAAAFLDMANYSANLGDAEAEKRYLTRAFDLRDTATAPTRLYIEARHATTITGDLFEGMRKFNTMAELYPRNAASSGRSVGNRSRAWPPRRCDSSGTARHLDQSQLHCALLRCLLRTDACGASR